MQIYSYPSIYNIGHRAVQSIFSENVYVQEKVDGSQISFGRKDGQLQIRSKNNDITYNTLTKMYCTEARWRKAVQHLREKGELDDSPKDIGALIKEIPLDILGDSKENIKEQLFSFFWPKIKMGVTKGFPEWYKNQLAESAFPCD